MTAFHRIVQADEERVALQEPKRKMEAERDKVPSFLVSEAFARKRTKAKTGG